MYRTSRMIIVGLLLLAGVSLAQRQQVPVELDAAQQAVVDRLAQQRGQTRAQVLQAAVDRLAAQEGREHLGRRAALVHRAFTQDATTEQSRQVCEQALGLGEGR